MEKVDYYELKAALLMLGLPVRIIRAGDHTIIRVEKHVAEAAVNIFREMFPQLRTEAIMPSSGDDVPDKQTFYALTSRIKWPVEDL